MEELGRFTIAPDHPALPGHFPGNPVVPGVVVLDEAAVLVAQAVGAGMPTVAGLPKVKFVGVVRPGQEVCVLGAPGSRGERWRFECRVAGAAVATGEMELTDAGDGAATAP